MREKEIKLTSWENKFMSVFKKKMKNLFFEKKENNFYVAKDILGQAL